MTQYVDAHLKLVSIHPFVDGNGRTARLLMNMLLMQAGYPPAVIRKEDRAPYIASIKKIQLKGSRTDYDTLMYKAIERSLDIYINALKGNEQKQILEKKSFLKIGDLAKILNLTVPTIRHWTKEGLFHIDQYSPGGYHLYTQNNVKTAQKILMLKNTKRLTLEEIKKVLLKD